MTLPDKMVIHNLAARIPKADFKSVESHAHIRTDN